MERNNPMKENVAHDGTKQGQPIPGSKYLRGFCEDCRRPIRVTPEQHTAKCVVHCTECDGANGIAGVSRSEKSLDTIESDPDIFGILKY